MNIYKRLHHAAGIASILLLLIGCSAPSQPQTPSPHTISPVSTATAAPNVAAGDEGRADGLSDEEVATLGKLEQVDDYPLYTMHYQGPYQQPAATIRPASAPEVAGVLGRLQSPNASRPPSPWGCSLFAALGDVGHNLYGRNFDWEYSPALLLFTDPPDGHASVSMVDIAYLGFGGSRANGLAGLPLVERRALLRAPFLPFDGMNEHGLAVGMAAVPGSQMPYDPDKETIDSLMIIRKMLDHARDVDEALALLQEYNIDWSGGPPLHFLIADASGRAILVEFYKGEMAVIPNEAPWHLATNFLCSTAGETGQGRCWRYDEISGRLTETEGGITPQDAMDLLAHVSQGGTQWSIVYEMSTGDVYVAMGRSHKNVHTFHLPLASK